MPITVKFKSDQENPCPHYATSDDLSKTAWQAARGKEVILEDTVPESYVLPAHRCGSDTYWRVTVSGAIAEADSIAHPDDHNSPVLVCRHVLDIGD